MFFKAHTSIFSSNKAILAYILFTLLACIFALFLGAYLQRRFGGIPQAAKYTACNKVPQLQHLAQGEISLLRGMPHLELALKQDAFDTISQKRAKALRQGALIKSEDDFVSAQLKLDELLLPANIRLKGDLLDHLRGDKWSFRVRLKSDASLMGMKRFSLHRPETRHHVWEWLALQMMQAEGLIALRYDFVQLTLNGKYLGIYALEEHFEKRVIENNQRREGPILKFDMTQWQQERLGYDGRALPGSGSFYSNPIDVFSGNKILDDSLLREQFLAGQALLEGFRLGKLKASEVFEVEAFATFAALCDLLGAQHALNTHQFRFYFNPLNNRLEPLPYDHNAGHRIDRLAGSVSDADYYRWEAGFQTLFLAKLFKDRDFYAAYIQALQRISEPTYLADFLTENDSILQNKLQWIWHEYPCFEFDKGMLTANQAYIRKMLSPPQALFAYQKNATEIELANRQSMPIEVIGLYRKDSIIFSFPQKAFLQSKHPKFSPQFISQQVPSAILSKDSLSIAYSLPGQTKSHFVSLNTWPFWDQKKASTSLAIRRPTLEQFPQLIVDHDQKSIQFPLGQFNLYQPLICPRGYQLIANAGCEIMLQKGAYILVQGPVSFLGNEEQVILVQGSKMAGGLFVMETDSISRFEHVLFSRLEHMSQGGWQPTGTVSCYESPADFRHCRWQGCDAEDALHLMRGEYALANCQFDGNWGDALDADFCRLHLTACSFYQSKNDAIDLSGSMAFLRNVLVDQAGDKGISVGEASRLEGWDIHIQQAHIGLASKDLSDVQITRLTTNQNAINIAAYQKKPEFGPAKVTVQNWQKDQDKDSIAIGNKLIIN